jgi:aspartate kinase
MALIVQKYGGTSVGSLERIRAVADRILKTRAQGHDVVVVLSAMSGETDRLIQLAYAVDEQPHPREYDVLLATGEQASTALMCVALNAKGCPARSYTGYQAGIITDDSHKKARILEIEASLIRRDLAEGKIPVVAGFQGVDKNGNITTLGRGGSDTTAVALAAALKADECQIYTDVEGVYTTDPHIVPQARRLERITFEEMLELSSLGAKVLQIRSVEFAGKYNVPVRVLSSFVEGPGTLIALEEYAMEHPLISGVAFDRDQAKLTILGIPDRPGIASHILNTISERDIDIDMIVQNIPSPDRSVDFSFTVRRDDYKDALTLLHKASEQLNARGVLGDEKIAKLSIVGVGMRSHAGVATKMFTVLGEEGINIQLISTSEIKISVIIDEKYLELGARTLHAAFGLDREPKDETRQ